MGINRPFKVKTAKVLKTKYLKKKKKNLPT